MTANRSHIIVNCTLVDAPCAALGTRETCGLTAMSAVNASMRFWYALNASAVGVPPRKALP